MKCVPTCVIGETPLQNIQRKCKNEYNDFQDKDIDGQDSCTQYKDLVRCIAKVNFTAVSSFVGKQNPDNCEFSIQEIKELQKYNITPTTVSLTTQTAAGSLTRMKSFFFIVAVILSALVF